MLNACIIFRRLVGRSGSYLLPEKDYETSMHDRMRNAVVVTCESYLIRDRDPFASGDLRS